MNNEVLKESPKVNYALAAILGFLSIVALTNSENNLGGMTYGALLLSCAIWISRGSSAR